MLNDYEMQHNEEVELFTKPSKKGGKHGYSNIRPQDLLRFLDGPDDHLNPLNNELIILEIGKSFHIFL
ncbi:MAG: hypothetical protein JRF62_16020 [Deltaproteobacteria bacterium]|nr:hypothetical protein [Deltaproteobacteria bacterium]